jgi:hypothetical protein
MQVADGEEGGEGGEGGGGRGGHDEIEDGGKANVATGPNDV